MEDTPYRAKADAPSALTSNSPVHGLFAHPTMAAIRAPAGITGRGSLWVRPGGLVIDAQRSPIAWINLAGCSGVFIGFFVSAVIALKMGIKDGELGALGVLLAVVGSMRLVRKLVKPRPLRVVVPWSEVRDVELRGESIHFRLAREPRGWVWFASLDAAGLADIASHARARV